MEITEKDMKHFAYYRFNATHMRHFYGMVFGLLGLMVGLMFAIHPASLGGALAIAIPCAAAIVVGILLYIRAAGKAANALLEQLGTNPTLTYVPEVKTNAEKVVT